MLLCRDCSARGGLAEPLQLLQTVCQLLLGGVQLLLVSETLGLSQVPSSLSKLLFMSAKPDRKTNAEV